MRIRMQEPHAHTYWTDEYTVAYCPGMEVKAIIDALMEKGWQQDHLAREFGVSQPTISRWRRGSSPQGPRFVALIDLARQEGLISDEDVPDDRPRRATAASAEVPIMGLIGAGGHVEPDYEQVDPMGLYAVQLPFAIPADMIGFEVIGSSMRPRFERRGTSCLYIVTPGGRSKA